MKFPALLPLRIGGMFNINPADHGTRGLKSTDSAVKWTKGPKFLTKNAQHWPTRPNSSSADNVCAFASAKYPPVLLDVRRFSSWLRLYKTTAQVIRFVRRLRSRNSDTGLITADFQLARLLLIRQSQAESFSSTVAHLNCTFVHLRKINFCRTIQSSMIKESFVLPAA